MGMTDLFLLLKVGSYGLGVIGGKGGICSGGGSQWLLLVLGSIGVCVVIIGGFNISPSCVDVLGPI